MNGCEMSSILLEYVRIAHTSRRISSSLQTVPVAQAEKTKADKPGKASSKQDLACFCAVACVVQVEKAGKTAKGEKALYMMPWL